MTAHVKVGGVWKPLNPKVKVGGAWHGLNGGFVRVAGVWRKFYPAPGVLDVQHMTTGYSGLAGNQSIGFYLSGPSIGALADGTSNIFGGAQILGIYWNEAPKQLGFAMTGNQPDHTWTTMNANGVNYTRAAANGWLQSGGNTYWTWDNVLANPLANDPTVTFT